MSQTITPPHHLVRAHLERRTYPAEPMLPSQEEIRRQLGLALINAERQTRAERDERS